jgi:hypothetical protein
LIASTPVEDISVPDLEDYMFRLSIISFAADMDAFRSPRDKQMFEGIAAFQEKLSEAIDFFRLLIKPESDSATEPAPNKYLQDIAYQGNILLFYTRGEVSHEKLGHMLNDAQKAAFENICDKINDFIQYTHKVAGATEAAGNAEHRDIADMLYGINADMLKAADDLDGFGGAIRFLAEEFRAFADRITSLIKK